MGAVLSIFTAGEVVKVAVFPATSVTVTCVVSPVPSVLMMAGEGGALVATPESASAVV